MSDPRPGESVRSQRRPALLVVAALAALAVVLAVVWSVSDRGGDAAAGTPTPSASATDRPTPTDQPTEPEVDPTTEPPDPSGDPLPAEPTTPTDQDGRPIEGARPSAPPVDLVEPAAPEQGIRVDLASIEAVQGESTLPGEVAGPALRVTVQVTNRTDRPVPLGAAVVNLYVGADRVPATSLLQPGSRALPVTVEPGASVTGVWVFSVPVDERADVQVEVDLANDLTVVQFQGAVG